MEEKYIEPDVLRVVKRNKNNEEFEKINNRSPKYEKNLNNKKANNSKKTIRGPKAENTRYKGKKGIRNRFISLALAATAVLGMGTTAVGIEDYNDKNEKIIATVQDVENDKFKDSAPAKIDWDQRKKVTSVELVDGKYYEVSSNSIVFVQEDKIRPGDKKNDVIILTEDGLVEGKMVGEYLQETPYQLNKEAKEKYVNTYMVTADSEATLMSSNGNEIMQILPGEYILASSLEKKDQNGNAVLDVLYVNEKVKIKPIVFGGEQQKNVRSGTENVPGIAGIGLAAKEIYSNLEDKVAVMRELKDYFIEGVSKIDNITIHGRTDETSAPHIISVGFAGIRSEVLLHTLEEKGIYVSSGSACASNHPAISGVLKGIGASVEYLDATLRFSLSEFTTKEEIDYTLETLYQCVPMLRKYTRH